MHQRQQFVAGRVQRLAAEFDRFAFHREAADLQHVVHRQAVFQAVHAAGVLGHVATDGAGDLAGRVGRVVQAMGGRRLADGQVAHPALHARRARQRVDGQDAVEARQRQRHPPLVRQRAARQPGAGAARHHRHTQAVAHAQHLAHLLRRVGQRHRQRPLAIGGQAIAFIGRGLLIRPQQRMRGQNGL